MPDITGRLRTPRLSAAPTTPAVGEVYYDTGANILYWWNGTTWVSMAASPSQYPYTFNATTASPPASGEVRFDNANPWSVANVWLNFIDRNGVSRKFDPVKFVQPGMRILISLDSSNYASYLILGAPTSSSYVSFSVLALDVGGTIAAGPVTVSFPGTTLPAMGSTTAGKVLTMPTPANAGAGPFWGTKVAYTGAYDNARIYSDGDFAIGADGITYQCVMENTVGVTPVPFATAPVLPYGTTLPASPGDGQEAVLVDSITNPSYQWRFRYNAGSTSAYKWEFIGGSQLYLTGYVGAYQQFSGNGSWVQGQPSFPVPRAGEYTTSEVGQFTATVVNTLIQFGAGASNGTQAATAVATYAAVANDTFIMAHNTSFIVVTAGLSIVTWFYSNAATTSVANLGILILPKRVA